MTTPTREESLKRLHELCVEREAMLQRLKTAIEQSINKGYDFGLTYICQYSLIVQVESQLRELTWTLYGDAVHTWELRHDTSIETTVASVADETR